MWRSASRSRPSAIVCRKLLATMAHVLALCLQSARRCWIFATSSKNLWLSSQGRTPSTSKNCTRWALNVSTPWRLRCFQVQTRFNRSQSTAPSVKYSLVKSWMLNLKWQRSMPSLMSCAVRPMRCVSESLCGSLLSLLVVSIPLPPHSLSARPICKVVFTHAGE